MSSPTSSTKKIFKKYSIPVLVPPLHIYNYSSSSSSACSPLRLPRRMSSRTVSSLVYPQTSCDIFVLLIIEKCLQNIYFILPGKGLVRVIFLSSHNLSNATFNLFIATNITAYRNTKNK